MKTEKYIEQKKRLPEKGRQIIGSHDGDSVTVYQAFNPLIANYAVSNQKFGGTHYSFNRMTWIKPGFLWMMYRSGWGAKEQQQHILAITIPMQHLKTILREATISSFDSRLFESESDWKNELVKTDVRLQWDPDHDPYGNKQDRKAIQIGMKGETQRKFCTEWISKIEDITGFVKEEHTKVVNQQIEELNVPYEDIIDLQDPAIDRRIGIGLQ